MSGRTFHRVTVLKGGPSAEREVSLATGAAAARALRAAGYEVTELDAGEDLMSALREAAPDAVFNALHGRWGEDGCAQGILEWMRIPYTHSGILASALAMDKSRAKEAFRAVGLPVAEGRLLCRTEAETSHPLPPPYVVKPNNEGSSVGVCLVKEQAGGPARLDASMPDTVMVEKFAPGREMTTTVMGNRALGVTDILTGGWYDYDAKYMAGGSRHVIPADIPGDVEEACLDYALRAHNALACRGVTRTDFRWDETRGTDGLIILEINTQPGLTPTSLAPEQAAHIGMDFSQFCAWMVEDASCRR
ncbi:MAG: D-alanine--D-alanine ligase [Rhodobacteraceae bacterium]|nr:D-alanine--D-alanine ligase [Paracoccaceae bacterium]